MDDPLAGDTVSTRARVWHTPLPSCSLLLPLHLHALHALFCAWCLFWSLLCGPLLSLLPVHCRTHTHTRLLLASSSPLSCFLFLFLFLFPASNPAVLWSRIQAETDKQAQMHAAKLGWVSFAMSCCALQKWFYLPPHGLHPDK